MWLFFKQMNEQIVAIGALGRVINLSDRRIQQLMKEGVLERHEKGRYPFLSNVKAYVVYLQARADGGGTVIDLEDARKRKLGAEARLAEIELQKAEEEIISVDAHSEVIGKIADVVRGRLTAIPSKTAPALALENKQTVCKEIVEHEIRECLQEVSRTISDDNFFEGKESTEETGQEVSATSETKRRRVGRPRKGAVL